MKFKIILISVIILLTLSTASAGFLDFLDNRVSCDYFSAKLPEGYHKADDTLGDNYLYIVSNDGNYNSDYGFHINQIADTGEWTAKKELSYESKLDPEYIEKNVTDGNFKAYKINHVPENNETLEIDNETYAIITKDGYTYEATWSHRNGTVYDDNRFNNDVKILKETMNTIERV